MAVLGPGTGLGVACLVDRSDRRVVIASEGGHATLAPTCEQEDRIVNHLRKRFGHVSAERVISGSGLENIYQAIAALEALKLPRTPLVASVSLPDDRCRRFALFWDPLREMWR
jgi:glucokinase